MAEDMDLQEYLYGDVDMDTVKRARYQYEMEKTCGISSEVSQFVYAMTLLKSQSLDCLRFGVKLLQELYANTKDISLQQNYLWFISIAHAKFKEYEAAKTYCNTILTMDPGNAKALTLKRTIEEVEKKDGLLGLAIAGGVSVAAVASLVGFGMAASRMR